jgi:hypothetical protein
MSSSPQDRPAVDTADLVRALTALQLGTDILMSLAAADDRTIDAGPLIQSLTAATERATRQITALGMAARRSAAPQ